MLVEKNKTSPTRFSFKNVGAAFLISVFFSQHVVFAYSIENNFWKDRKSTLAAKASVSGFSPRSLESLQLFSALSPLATVQQIHRSENPEAPTIYYLQDIHGNQSAQKNLSLIIAQLLKRGPSTVIGLEGASGPISLNSLRASRSDVNHEVASFYFNESLIAGPEKALIEADRAPECFGLEDKSLYEKNILAAKESLKLAPAVSVDIARMRAELNQLEAQGYTAALLGLEKNRHAWIQGSIPLNDYILKLRQAAPSVSLEKYLSLVAYLEASQSENKIDLNKANQEKDGAWKKIQPKILEMAAGREFSLSRADYIQLIFKSAKAAGVNWDEYPHFARVLKYMSAVEKIQISAMLAEVQSFEDRVWKKTALSPEMREIHQKDITLDLLEKLTRLQLTHDEWKRLSSETLREQFSTKNAGLQPFFDFYEHAENRNSSMAKNFMQHLSPQKKNYVLVTGGFHSQVVIDLLKSKANIICLSPQMEIGDHMKADDYLAVFNQPLSKLESWFALRRETLKSPLGVTDSHAVAVTAPALHQLFPTAIDTGDADGDFKTFRVGIHRSGRPHGDLVSGRSDHFNVSVSATASVWSQIKLMVLSPIKEQTLWHVLPLVLVPHLILYGAFGTLSWTLTLQNMPIFIFLIIWGIVANEVVLPHFVHWNHRYTHSLAERNRLVSPIRIFGTLTWVGGVAAQVVFGSEVSLLNVCLLAMLFGLLGHTPFNVLSPIPASNGGPRRYQNLQLENASKQYEKVKSVLVDATTFLSALFTSAPENIAEKRPSDETVFHALLNLFTEFESVIDSPLSRQFPLDAEDQKILEHLRILNSLSVDTVFDPESGFKLNEFKKLVNPQYSYVRSSYPLIDVYLDLFLHFWHKNPNSPWALLAWKRLVVGPEDKAVAISAEKHRQLMQEPKLGEYYKDLQKGLDPKNFDRTAQREFVFRYLIRVKEKMGGISKEQAVIELNLQRRDTVGPEKLVSFYVHVNTHGRLEFTAHPQEVVKLNGMEWGTFQHEHESGAVTLVGLTKTKTGKSSSPEIRDHMVPFFTGTLFGSEAHESGGGIQLTVPQSDRYQEFSNYFHLGDNWDDIERGIVREYIRTVQAISGPSGIHSKKPLIFDGPVEQLSPLVKKHFDISLKAGQSIQDFLAAVAAISLNENTEPVNDTDGKVSRAELASLTKDFVGQPNHRGRFEALFRDASNDRGGWVHQPKRALRHVEEIEQKAQEYKKAGVTELVFVGMGGESSVLGRSWESLDKKNKVSVISSPHPLEFKPYDLARLLQCHWFFVTKSFRTDETLSDLRELIRILNAHGLDPKKYITLVTDPGSSLDTHYAVEFAGYDRLNREIEATTAIGGRNTLANYQSILAFAWKYPGQLKAMLERLIAKFQNPLDDWVLAANWTTKKIQEGRPKVALIIPSEFQELSTSLQQNPEESLGKNNGGFTAFTTRPDLATLKKMRDQRWVFIEIQVKGHEQETTTYAQEALRDGHPVKTIIIDESNLAVARPLMIFGWMKFVAFVGRLWSINGINFSDQPPVESFKRVLLRTPPPELSEAIAAANSPFSPNVKATVQDENFIFVYDGLLPYLTQAQIDKIMYEQNLNQASPSTIYGMVMGFVRDNYGIDVQTLAYNDFVDGDVRKMMDTITQDFIHKRTGFSSKWDQGPGVLHGLFVNWMDGNIHQIPVHIVAEKHEGGTIFPKGSQIFISGAVAAHQPLQKAWRPSVMLISKSELSKPSTRENLTKFFNEATSPNAGRSASVDNEAAKSMGLFDLGSSLFLIMLGWSFSHMGFVMGGYGLLALGLTAFMMKAGGTIFKHLTTALIQGMMSVLHFGAVRFFNSLQAALSWIQDEAPHVVMMMDVGESGSFGDADMARLNAVVQRANQIKTRGDVNLMVIDHANTAASIAAITNILRNTSALSMRVPMISQLKNADGLINDDAVLQQAGADFVAVQSVLSGASNKNSIEMVSLNPALHVRSSRLQTILILITQILGRWMVLEKGYLGNMIEAAHLAGVNA